MSDSYNPVDSSPPGSSAHGISQARIWESVAISFFRGSSWPRNWIWVSCIAGRFFTTEPLGKPSYYPSPIAVKLTQRESDFPKAPALAVPEHERLLLSPLCLQFYQGAKPPGTTEIVTKNGFLKWDLGPEHDWNLSTLSRLLLVSSVRCLNVVVGFILKRQTMFV